MALSLSSMGEDAVVAEVLLEGEVAGCIPSEWVILGAGESGSLGIVGVVAASFFVDVRVTPLVLSAGLLLKV